MVSKKSLFWWVKTSNLKLQVIVLILIVITVFARVFPLQMQKQIINQAIRFKDLHLLLIYCGLYIGAVVLSGVLTSPLHPANRYPGLGFAVSLT